MLSPKGRLPAALATPVIRLTATRRPYVRLSGYPFGGSAAARIP